MSPALAGEFFTTETPGNPCVYSILVSLISGWFLYCCQPGGSHCLKNILTNVFHVCFLFNICARDNKISKSGKYLSISIKFKKSK